MIVISKTYGKSFEKISPFVIKKVINFTCDSEEELVKTKGCGHKGTSPKAKCIQNDLRSIQEDKILPELASQVY